jgi:hypothetical protein
VIIVFFSASNHRVIEIKASLTPTAIIIMVIIVIIIMRAGWDTHITIVDRRREKRKGERGERVCFFPWNGIPREEEKILLLAYACWLVVCALVQFVR